MIPIFQRWLRRRPKIRLKPPGQVAPKGLTAFFAKPAVGRFYWFLAWCVVMLFVGIAMERDMSARVGRPSPATIISLLDVSVDGPSPEYPESGRFQIPKGTVIVERGQVVTPDVAGAVDAYGRALRAARYPAGRLARTAGDGVILLIGVVVCAVMLRVLKPDVAADNSTILLFVIISLVTVAASRWYYLLDRFDLFLPVHSLDFLLPLALAPLLSAILLGQITAVVMGFWVSLAAAVLSGYSLAVFTVGFVSAVVVARMTWFVRTRAAVLRIGLCAGLAGAACALGFSAISHYPLEHTALACLFSIGSGIISALIALLILPFFETAFGISTDISLLELSDFEHPLLKRLAIEAPGTYHHSLMVANLSQAAIAVIGGNALRVSICSYFHDIGKLVKPTFFSENTQFAENPHDDLSPSMSTLVVISHVKEGVNLALRHKLPKPVVDAIQQHHGTGLVYYFYRKARDSTQMELDLRGKSGGHPVNEEDFRYAGPKPRSREIAVLSLADSIEASSRSLEKISAGNIEHLVNDVVDAKLRDGQLDECSLTLAEINRIKKAFIFTLSNMLHGRISYPNNEHRSKQQAVAGAPEHGGDKEAGKASD